MAQVVRAAQPQPPNREQFDGMLRIFPLIPARIVHLAVQCPPLDLLVLRLPQPTGNQLVAEGGFEPPTKG